MSEAGPESGSVVQQLAESAQVTPDNPESRRIDERFPAARQAEIVLNGGKSMFRGRILNISQSGCFFHVPSSESLTPGTPVQIHVTIKGRILRLPAQARFSKTKDGVGFRFTALSDSTRSELTDLIRSLRTQPAAPR
jgi:hypothetical protein